MWDAIHSIARSDKQVYDAINRFAAFWNVVIRSLQANSLIVLGRIFDTDSQSHSVGRLLRIAETNGDIFSKVSLEKRKRLLGGNVGEWIDQYMKDVYVPRPHDFQVLRQRVKRSRAIYDKRYGPLRNKYVAHRDRADVTGLFASTNIRDLQRILVSLKQVHDALWEFFMNGWKFDFRRGRYSTNRILNLRNHVRRDNDEQEWITGTTQKFLNYLREKS
jgi:AbiU2